MFTSGKRRLLAIAALLQVIALPADADRLSAAASIPVPAVEGSLSPHLSVGVHDTLVLSWLEPIEAGFALRFSRWGESGWQAPLTVASGNNWFINWADFPSVVPITGKFWVAHWLVRRAAGGYAYDVMVAVSNDGGESWSEGFRLHSDDTDTEHGFVSIYRATDGAGIVWLDGRNMVNENAGMTLRHAVLHADGSLQDTGEIDSLACDCCQTAAVATGDGPIVAYRDRSASEIRDIYVSRENAGSWSSGEPVANDDWKIGGCPVNGPAMANIGSTLGIAWFTAVNDEPRVRLSRSADSGNTFEVPVDVVDGNTSGRVGLALLPDGTAFVSALTDRTGQSAQLTLTRVDANGRRYTPVIIATDVHPLSVPQLQSHSDALVVAWTVRKDGKTNVRSARLPVQEAGSLATRIASKSK